LSREEKCKRKDTVLWTPIIQQSNLRVQYWNIRFKSSKQRIDANKPIRQIIPKMDINSIQLLHENKRSVANALTKATEDHEILYKENY
jgi:hypothetical protein